MVNLFSDCLKYFFFQPVTFSSFSVQCHFGGSGLELEWIWAGGCHGFTESSTGEHDAQSA